MSKALAPGEYYTRVSPRRINKSPEAASSLLVARSRVQETQIGAGATVVVTLAPRPAE
jgi:hypothetical protein